MQIITWILCLTLVVPSPQNSFRDARKAIRDQDYQRAIQLFEAILENQGERGDEALYWQAYALAKTNRITEALEALAQLKSNFPESRWRDDAEALMIELSPNARNIERQNTELKLVALSALMNQDPERAEKALHKFLEGNVPVASKRRALFILVQHRHEETGNLVERIARGEVYPELRVAALETMGHFNREYSIGVMMEIYSGENDTRIKEKILNSLMVANAHEQITTLAREEADGRLRKKAIQLLGVMGAEETLVELYALETDDKVKRAFIDAFSVSGATEHLLTIIDNETSVDLKIAATRSIGIHGDCGQLSLIYREHQDDKVRKAALDGMHIGQCSELAEIARNENDPRLRAKAVKTLGLLGKKFADDILAIYMESTSREVKSAAIDALFIQRDATQLIALAKSESDIELKRKAVTMIGMLNTEEAKDFLLELLEEQ